MSDLLTAIWDDTIAFVREHIALAGPIVFLLGMGESIAVLSLLIPSTFLFLAIGGLHSAAGGHYVPMALAGAAGAFTGDVLSYLLGRYFRADIGNAWPFRTRPEWYMLARSYCGQWGGLAVIASKFTAGLRPFVPVVAGALETPLWRFLPASAVSCLLWAGVFLAPGYGVTLLRH
jgi:membrane protein DedA with SNARE-associated domain